MCGICGLISLDKKNLLDKEIVYLMTEVMKHRGPDDEGYFFHNFINMGHRRLSIIDLSTGHQPIFNEDKSCSIILNGEIYNFRELRKKLETKGHVFKTKTDTEVIVHAYEEYGFDCVRIFDGMFAFALWDEKKQILFLARDRLGKKPLYYYCDSTIFIFSSEIKGLIRTGKIKPEVSYENIDEFLTLGYVVAPNTLFKNIKKLLPGHILIVQNGQILQQEYWQLDSIREEKNSFSNFQEQLKLILEDAVRKRLISDVPLGVFLSGGIDSSIIVGLMAKFSKTPVKTFSIGYKDKSEHSELCYARIVANHFGTEHYEIVLEPVDFYDAIPQMIWHLEEPIADQACIPLWLMSKKAKKYVTVLLSGEGSDELFGGYPIYNLMRGLQWYRGIPRWLRYSFFDPLFPIIFGERRGQKYKEWARLPIEDRFLGDMADLSNYIKHKLYSKDLIELSLTNNFKDKIHYFYDKVRGRDILDRMQFLDIKTWLADNLLLKADKMTMAASVELRCPFLDYRLVEFSRRIPSKWKIKGFTTKFILKQTYKDFLPKGIVNRRKQGFPVPLAIWFQGNLSKQIASVLLNERSLDRGYFNRDFIKEIIEKQYSNREDYSKLLWSLLVLEYWHRVFIDKEICKDSLT
ncbi:MAG: asparagine synthase (glutamine-hydrolyzing) [Candidatus Omnitrophica bacterium]|nr:asparagine synthase (glutamine-hydrolyzing) [Candidatus Omnitrophota bacterium]